MAFNYTRNRIINDDDSLARSYPSNSSYTFSKITFGKVNFEIIIKTFAKANYIKFEHCLFKNDVSFSKNQFCYSFIDCTFNESLLFDDIDSEINLDSGLYGVFLNNCICKKAFVINKCKFSAIEIYNSDLGEVRVRATLGGSFGVVNTKVHEYRMENGTLEYVNLFNSELNSTSIYFSEINTINFEASQFNKECLFQSIKVEKWDFTNCNSNGLVGIYAIERGDDLIIEGGEYRRGFLVQDTVKVFNNVYISSVKFHSPFRIIGVKTTWKSIIEDLHIRTSSDTQGTLEIKNCDVHRIEIEGDNHSANIILNNLKVQLLQFTSFSNYGNMILSDIESDNGVLELDTTNLGRATLYNVNLDSFREISIHNSILREITVSGVNWFDSDKVKVRDNKSSAKKELFQQLRHAMEAQGERIKALDFKRLEMKEYKKIIDKDPINTKNVGNKIMMTLNQSNDYGDNYIKPIILLFFFSFLSYTLISFSLFDDLTFGFIADPCGFSNTLHYLGTNIGRMFIIMNPIHSIRDVFEVETDIGIGSAALIFSFLQRLIATYLGFQIISAFRKYVK